MGGLRGGSNASGMAATVHGPLVGAFLVGFALCLFSGSRSAPSILSSSSSSYSVGAGSRELNSREHSAETADETETEEGGEEEHGYDFEEIVSEAITCIVLLLILLTIGFEKVKEHIEESAGRNMKPIISSLFGELTVLGFLSIFTFVVTKLGAFESLSKQIFGEEEAEELLEIFESVHYALFLVMIFFVLLVLFLVKAAVKTEEEWLEMDRASRDPEYMKELVEKYQEEQSGGGGSILRSLKSCFVSAFPSLRRRRNDSVEDQLHFHALRREFILERSVAPPFRPAAKENRVGDDFNFGRYLSISLEHTLAHGVHLDAVTWFSLALFMIVFYFLTIAARMDQVVLSWIWASFGWILFAMASIFDHHLLGINQSLASLDGFLPEATDPERQKILASPDNDTPLPPWCSIDLDAYLEKRSFFARKFNKTTPNRQDSLFWFERRGPRMIKLCFQIILVFTAVYDAILVLTFLPAMYRHSSTMTLIGFAFVSIAPIILMRLQRRHLAAQMSKVTSVGFLRKPQIVATVIREEKTARVVRAFIILYKMQHMAEVGLQEKPQDHVDTALLDSVEISEVGKTFDNFDHSGDGNISVDELWQIMSSLGAPINDKVLSNMVSVLDQNKNGEISKDEFINFYARHIMADNEESSTEHRAHFMFNMFDASGDKEITIGEFKSALDAFNVGLHVDDVGELIRELDEDEKGTLGEEEFHHLLEKYEPYLRNYSPKAISAY